MPLLVHPIDLPEDLIEIHAADVDADEIDELVFVSAKHSGRRPDAITVTVVDVDAAGDPTGRRAFPLGRKAQLWDVGPGIWTLGRSGATNLLVSTMKPVPVSTLLRSLGPTSPVQAPFLTDLDHNGLPELVAHDGRGLVFVDLDARTTHPLSARAYGQVQVADERGGTQLVISAQWPRTEVADVDGDGLDDIIMLNGDHLKVWPGQSGAPPGEGYRVNLPIDIDPYQDPKRPPDADRKPIERVWLRDVNADGKVDLVVHRAVVAGSWLGATAELAVSLGTGTSFGTPTVVQTEALAVDVELEDVDSDGDLDLVVPQVDITLSNMARGLLAKRMQIDVGLFEWDGGLSTTPTPLRGVTIPIEDTAQVQVELAPDLTGDGLSDMVFHEGDGPVVIFAGSKSGMSDTPWAEVQVAVPPGEDSLFVHDVTGDGRPEIIVWGPGYAAGSILTVE